MRLLIVGVLTAALLATAASAARAGVGQEATQKLYDRVTPSLVAVKYTWESELGRRELAGMGVVVREDGLVICQLALFNMLIPDEQLTDFKIIVPDPAGGVQADQLGPAGADRVPGRHPDRGRLLERQHVPEIGWPVAQHAQFGGARVTEPGRHAGLPADVEERLAHGRHVVASAPQDAEHPRSMPRPSVVACADWRHSCGSAQARGIHPRGCVGSNARRAWATSVRSSSGLGMPRW